tara:strand:- start:21 stop:329 length:309 start_codon:yes stop_codon:yes gene_type:complete
MTKATKFDDFLWKLEKNIKNINQAYILYLFSVLIVIFILRKLNISYFNIILLAIGLCISYLTISSNRTVEEKILLILTIFIVIIGPVINDIYNYHNKTRKKR